MKLAFIGMVAREAMSSQNSRFQSTEGTKRTFCIKMYWNRRARRSRWQRGRIWQKEKWGQDM